MYCILSSRSTSVPPLSASSTSYLIPILHHVHRLHRSIFAYHNLRYRPKSSRSGFSYLLLLSCKYSFPFVLLVNSCSYRLFFFGLLVYSRSFIIICIYHGTFAPAHCFYIAYLFRWYHVHL
ncbi:hypothetical protein C8R42DRAFT_173449 [Lentinula raphanica]|nr:hypothetical protein C8R42DRAFT_173449 [Lentinula raphanica]